MQDKSRRSGHYYSRITLIYAVLICLITAVTISICNILLSRQKRSEALEDYEITLNGLSNALTSRLTSLSNAFSPLFTDMQDYAALCSFYLHPTLPYPSETSDSVLRILSGLCQSNPYCQGVLLLTKSGRLFQYDPIYGSLNSESFRQTTFRFTPYQRQLLSKAQLSDLSLEYEALPSGIYGVSGTVFERHDNSVEDLGYLILLYSGDEFSEIVRSASLDGNAVFVISDTASNVLFASDGDYEEALSRIELFPQTVNGPVTVTYRGIPCHSSSIFSPEQDYLFTYLMPVRTTGSTYSQTVLSALGIFVCSCSILLYIISFRSSRRKIQSIREGMAKISQNNLDYRMEVPKDSDEFTQIIRYFNLMCDDLQQNVEKAYMYELSQRKAELYALQTSINPHFLYNSLEQIRVLTLSGRVQDAASSLLLLSRMYRTQTRKDLYITVAEEFSFIENLIEFYSYHYNNFEYLIDVENSVKKYGIPKNTLQPLLENYFVHGLKPDTEDNLLLMRCRAVNRDRKPSIFFEMQDNGRSIPEDKLAALNEKLSRPVLTRDEGSGFALSNVNARLTLVFGPQAALHPDIAPGGGFRITFSIPAILPENLSAGPAPQASSAVSSPSSSGL